MCMDVSVTDVLNSDVESYHGGYIVIYLCVAALIYYIVAHVLV